MIKFFAENLVKQSVIYTDSENKLFPKENIKDSRRTKVFRSIGNASEVTFDFLEASLIDTVIIVPDKKNFFGFTKATIELDSHGDFTTPLYSAELEIFEVSEIALKQFTEVEARFVRITLESSLDYCELSKVFVGKETPLGEQNGIDVGWRFTNDEIVSLSKNTLGQVFSDKIARQKKLDFSIRAMIEDELNAMSSITDTLGTTDPLFVLVNTKTSGEIAHKRSGYYRFTDIPSEANLAYGLYDSSYKLEEFM